MGLPLFAKDVKAVIDGLMVLAVASIKKNRSFEIEGWLIFLQKVKPASPARKEVHSLTDQAQVFKAKPASKTARVLPMLKLKSAVPRFRLV